MWAHYQWQWPSLFPTNSINYVTHGVQRRRKKLTKNTSKRAQWHKKPKIKAKLHFLRRKAANVAIKRRFTPVFSGYLNALMAELYAGCRLPAVSHFWLPHVACGAPLTGRSFLVPLSWVAFNGAKFELHFFFLYKTLNLNGRRCEDLKCATYLLTNNNSAHSRWRCQSSGALGCQMLLKCQRSRRKLWKSE